MAGRKPGHKRFRAGAWRLTVEGSKDPVTGKRKPVHATVHAPNTRDGERHADLELAKLYVSVQTQRALPSSGVTVEQLLVRWVENRRPGWEERSPGQPDATLDRIRNHITPHVGHVLVEQLRPVDVDDLYARWRSRGLAESTVRRMHAILHAGLAQAVRWDLRIDNPADRIEPPKPGKKRRNAPADEMLIALLQAAEDDLLSYLRLGAVTGARRGQLVGLRWSDISLDGATVLFTRALAKVKGGVKEKGTKSDEDYPVALDPRTVEILRAHRRQCVERALAVGVVLPADAYVFSRHTAPDGSKAWHPDGANQRFDRVREKVAKTFPQAARVTPHQFRHWMATAMFEDGYDPVEVAGRGGWSSPAVPLQIYGHFRPAKDQAAAASLALRLDGTASGP